MKLSDFNVKTDISIKPPRIVVYGDPKVGKSTFSSKTDSPIMIDIEGGSDGISVPRISDVKTLDGFKGFVSALLKDEHEYKTLVIDSLDWLERLVQQSICEEHGKSGIEDFGFGKGYTYVYEKFAKILAYLDRLRDERNMTILFLAHSHIKTHQDPLNDNYDKHTLKLHGKLCDLVTEWCDAVLYATKKIYTVKKEKGFGQTDTKAAGGSERVLICADTPSALAGNRYGLPRELPLEWNEVKTNIYKVKG